MPTIPLTQQYYPTVPVSELTDLYSKGANELGGRKIVIASYLPKTLRVSQTHHFNNQYVLFIEDTALVNSIEWEFQLLNRGENVEIPNFAQQIGSSRDTLYSLFFSKDSTDEFEGPIVDKLIVKCTVKLGAEEITLSVEHDVIQQLNPLNIENIGVDNEVAAFQGSTRTTRYILNHLKDYLPNNKITWNGEIIETDTSPEKENNLLKIVIGIIYRNIQVSINETPGFEFLYNINQDRNAGVEAFINDTTENKGNQTNGLCKIPLHILNEILTDISSVPNFEDIDSGDGNAVFNIIRGEGETSEEEKITSSTAKLEANTDRYVELFNLSVFPKSAIKLSCLLVKYLMECSKKNDCLECHERSESWKNLTIDELPETPLFVKNLLTHYLGKPSEQIENFLPAAKQTHALIWSPFVESIVRVAPRIIKAYFAKRVITRLPDEIVGGRATPVYTFRFERIDSSQTKFDHNNTRLDPQPDYETILGREVYLVVETLHARGQELTLNVKPSNRNLTNSLNALELNNGLDNDYSTDIALTIGDFDDLRVNTLDPLSERVQEYLSIDFRDKAIKKIRLHPEARATFDNWANQLANNTGQLYIEGKFSDEQMAFFGNESSGTASSGSFLSTDDKYLGAQFRIVNRIVYEIYHKDNPWNFSGMNGGNRKRQGKIDNAYIQNIPDGGIQEHIRNVVFYYHSQIDQEIFVAECAFNKPRRRAEIRANGPDVIVAQQVPNGSDVANVPAGFTSDAPAPAGGDAFHNYYYPDGSIVTRDNPAGGNRDYGILRYRLAGALLDHADVVELVNMPELNITFDYLGVTQRIIFTFNNTARTYANPGCFGSFIGVMAETNFNDNQCNGMCFADATSYPSRSHPNGDSIDLVHRARAAERTLIVTTFRNWGYTDIWTGNEPRFATDGADGRNGAHNDHLHSGGFLEINVHNII